MLCHALVQRRKIFVVQLLSRILVFFRVDHDALVDPMGLRQLIEVSEISLIPLLSLPARLMRKLGEQRPLESLFEEKAFVSDRLGLDFNATFLRLYSRR